MLISLVAWNDLLKRFNPTEEPFHRGALFVYLRIELYWSSPLWVFPVSPVDRDIAPDSPVPVVLSNLPGIVSRICRDDHWLLLRSGNLKCFDGWCVELGIVSICRGKGTGKGETVLIDQSTQLTPVYLFIAIIAGRSPFLAGIALVSVAQCVRSIFRISYPDRRRSRKIAWYTLFSHNSRWYRCTVDLVPYFAGTSCQVHPVVRTYRMPLNNPRGSHRGRPMCGFVGGRYFWTIAQRSSSISRNTMTRSFI
ncbi:hypothetical protein ES707_19108 [subsurface metagenome]